ncbi:MAG: hypothetical protein ACRDEA_07340, partial [Microcystaceae cyanobacterium]
MNAKLERAKDLKQALVDFVYDAEGELAVALEEYTAQRTEKERYDIRQQNLIVDTFLSEGKVAEKTPIELFLENEPNLTKSDRALVNHWRHSFTGLFELVQILSPGFELMNWLTAKRYRVFPSQDIPETTEMARWKPGDILLTRIAPVTDNDWMFSGACIPKGRLSKPKLAVVIGEFKKNYKNYLYSDAPELLEQAWESVATYHQEFVDFFGSEQVTLPGYQLNKKMTELQQKMSKKQLEAAGIDSSKSLKEIIQETGADEAELKAAAVEAGGDSESVTKAFENQEKSSMLLPKMDLPDEIKKAEQVTTFSHPRWGQMFVPTYSKFKAMLEAEEPQNQPNFESLVRKYLEDPRINFFIWQQLQKQYSTQLEKCLKIVLERPDFSLNNDLEKTLLQYYKPSEPELPEIASVPIHLHNLFEEAVAQVHKS